MTGSMGNRGMGLPFERAPENDIFAVPSQRLVLRQDRDLGMLRADLPRHDETERAPAAHRPRRRSSVPARAAGSVCQPVEGFPDVAEGDVAPESVAATCGPGPRHAGEVDREPERDERSDPSEVFGLDEPERRPVVPRQQSAFDCVEVERRPPGLGVGAECTELGLVPRGAGELRGHGQARRLPLDAERTGAERLLRQRARPHPSVLGRECEPAFGFVRDPARVDVSGGDVCPGLSQDAAGAARTMGECVSRHGDRGLPRSLVVRRAPLWSAVAMEKRTGPPRRSQRDLAKGPRVGWLRVRPEAVPAVAG